jgi:hypothetical protein
VFEAPAAMSTGITVVTDVTLIRKFADVSEELVVFILTAQGYPREVGCSIYQVTRHASIEVTVIFRSWAPYFCGLCQDAPGIQNRDGKFVQPKNQIMGCNCIGTKRKTDR